MPFDKQSLFNERGLFCECGCGKMAHDAHHALIHRMRRFPELDCPENIILVNHDEHIARKFDNLEWRMDFWMLQINRYGRDHMNKWISGLPDKLNSRLDFCSGAMLRRGDELHDTGVKTRVLNDQI